MFRGEGGFEEELSEARESVIHISGFRQQTI